jgi:20S proteasome subunit beta 2
MAAAPEKAAPLIGMELLQQQRGGFNFDLCKRNEILVRTGKVQPKMMKTGTTIVGVCYNDGVVLGADTRATEGPIVCDKNCEKIHRISDMIWCCGAGTSADTENVTGLISSQLELHRLATGAAPRVVTAMTRLKQHLFKYQGHVSAALVLGGVDSTGSYLYTVYPHGSTDKLPYATMGSGSLAAMAIFESKYKDDLDEKAAVALVDEAIQAGIFNDLGSGGNVDICILSKSAGTKTMLRNYKKPTMDRYTTPKARPFAKGTTAIIGPAVTTLFKSLVVETTEEAKVDKSSPPTATKPRMEVDAVA